MIPSHVYKFVLIIFLILSFACEAPNSKGTKEADSSYIVEWQEWQDRRIAALKKADGWLNLTGLHWLSPGINTIGSSSENNIVLKKEKVPDQAGSLIWEKGQIIWEGQNAFAFQVEEKPTSKAILYDEAKAINRDCTFESLRLVLIKRGDRMALRVRDLESVLMQEFAGTELFDLDPAWNLEGTFYPYEEAKDLVFDNVQDQKITVEVPGEIEFRHGEESFRLLPIIDEGRFLIIFSDRTSGDTSYGGGRFLFASLRESEGPVRLDFNQSELPPCAFTDFATCLLPPKTNRLPFPIQAGESKFSGLASLK